MMLHRPSPFVWLVVLALLVTTSGATAEEAGPHPVGAALTLGSTFTYQGQLTGPSGQVDAECSMQFGLYDAATAGLQVGTTVSDTVTVNDGLFTASLDFGSGAFDGSARWLEIAVLCSGDAGFTTLAPRQALTAAPYALYSLSAPWAGITGVPTDLADGDDDTTYTPGDGLALNGTVFSAQGSSYANVVTVAKSGGDYTSIQTALNNITANANNRYLVWVGPGTYTETVTMKAYVDIEGAGEQLTTITAAGSASLDDATVLGASSAELRSLTVVNTGGATFAVAIRNNSVATRLTQVIASASGGTFTYGVRNSNASPILTNVTANASGSGTSYGVYNSHSSPTMTNVNASASGASTNHGVFNSDSSPTMTNVNASASGGSSNHGVSNMSNSSPTITNSTASASGGSSTFGVYNDSSSPTMTNIIASGLGGSDPINYGVFSYSSAISRTVVINRSTIMGETATIYSGSAFTTVVGASQLAGGPVEVIGGTLICAGVYDEQFFYSDTICP